MICREINSIRARVHIRQGTQPSLVQISNPVWGALQDDAHGPCYSLKSCHNDDHQITMRDTYDCAARIQGARSGANQILTTLRTWETILEQVRVLYLLNPEES